MVLGDTVEDIDHRLCKGVTLAIGLVIENLRFRSKASNEFEIHDRLSLSRSGSEVTINIDILDMRRRNTNTGGIGCQVLGIVAITELRYTNRHALSLVSLLIELRDMICSR